jgi:hypothetical protein
MVLQHFQIPKSIEATLHDRAVRAKVPPEPVSRGFRRPVARTMPGDW